MEGETRGNDDRQSDGGGGKPDEGRADQGRADRDAKRHRHDGKGHDGRQRLHQQAPLARDDAVGAIGREGSGKQRKADEERDEASQPVESKGRARR